MKAQESYLAGVVYLTCRVNLSRSPGPDRYMGIRAKLSRFYATYGQSRIDKLVRWFDEDVEFLRVGVCNIPAQWAGLVSELL